MIKKIFLLSILLVLNLSLNAQGKIAPDFEFQMEDGSKKKLSDYKGQVVYLSFWASWCKPCIIGFEKYRKTRQQMEDAGVVLLNISIDEEYSKWEKAKEELNISGEHALVAQKEVQDLYQLYTIPAYEIIGKKGQFLYLSDDPGRSVLDEFKRFVKE